MILPGNMAAAKENTKDMQDETNPTDLTSMRSFLGVFNVYRRLMEGYAKLASPLSVITRSVE